MSEVIENEDNFSKEKLMYDNIYDELNRSRDWPIKIMTFSSALYLAVIAFIRINGNINLNCTYKWIISVMLAIFGVYTLFVIIRQHRNYFEYRNIQNRLQRKIGIYNWQNGLEKVFPDHWEVEKKVSVRTGFLGWSFYALYLTIACIITIILISIA